MTVSLWDFSCGHMFARAISNPTIRYGQTIFVSISHVDHIYDTPWLLEITFFSSVNVTISRLPTVLSGLEITSASGTQRSSCMVIHLCANHA